MGGDAREDLFKPGKWIDSGPLAGSHETPEHGSGLTTLVAAEEDPVISTARRQRRPALTKIGKIVCRIGSGPRGTPPIPSMLDWLYNRLTKKDALCPADLIFVLA